MHIFSKIFKGDYPNVRKNRFYDEKRNCIPFKRLIFNGYKAFFSAILLKIFKIRPVKPWLSYDAILEIGNFLDKNKRVLEFGSGMSTIWFCKHAGFVYSTENYKEWFDKIESILQTKKFQNIKYEFRSGDDFSNYMKDNKEKFDFILIDGYAREKCAANAIELIKQGGIIYLDNSDKDFDIRYAKDKTREAEQILADFAKKTNSTIQYFTDFAPTAFFAQQGMLIKVKNYLNRPQ